MTTEPTGAKVMAASSGWWRVVVAAAPQAAPSASARSRSRVAPRRDVDLAAPVVGDLDRLQRRGAEAVQAEAPAGPDPAQPRASGSR